MDQGIALGAPVQKPTAVLLEATLPDGSVIAYSEVKFDDNFKAGNLVKAKFELEKQYPGTQVIRKPRFD